MPMPVLVPVFDRRSHMRRREPGAVGLTGATGGPNAVYALVDSAVCPNGPGGRAGAAPSGSAPPFRSTPRAHAGSTASSGASSTFQKAATAEAFFVFGIDVDGDEDADGEEEEAAAATGVAGTETAGTEVTIDGTTTGVDGAIDDAGEGALGVEAIGVTTTGTDAVDGGGADRGLASGAGGATATG
jgi:hypothetical protein